MKKPHQKKLLRHMQELKEEDIAEKEQAAQENQGEGKGKGKGKDKGKGKGKGKKKPKQETV